jgi:hypothetical protein
MRCNRSKGKRIAPKKRFFEAMIGHPPAGLIYSPKGIYLDIRADFQSY